MRGLAGLGAMLAFLAPVMAGAACKGTDLLAQLSATDPAAMKAMVERARRVPNARGVFWRVEKPGVPASHLYGTMHHDGLEDTVPAAAWAALGRARVALFEMTRETTAALVADIRAGRVPDRDQSRPDFESFMKPADAVRLRAAFARAGHNGRIAHLYMPWKAIAILEAPPCYTISVSTPVLDEVFEQRAIRAGIRRIGLDDGRAILASDNRMPVGIFRDYLVVAARTANAGNDAFVTGLRLYRERRPVLYFEFYRWFAARAAPEIDIAALWAGMVNADLDLRTAAWMPVLVRELTGGNAFVAVGAGHLPYDFGLVARLRARGFKVTRIE